MKSNTIWVVGCLSALIGAISVYAAPVGLVPGANIGVYDTGGALNGIVGATAVNVIGGIEVDPVSGDVFVTVHDGGVGGTVSTLQLVMSTGLGSATNVGAAIPLVFNARGNDLTRNPADGLLYAVGTLSGMPGVHGLDPSGVAPPVNFATLSSGSATSGLVFNNAGTMALYSTDGAAAGVLPNGAYSIAAGGPEVPIALGGALPNGIPGGTDDIVVTLDGRTLIIGDGSHEIWDATGGAGALSLLVDLDTIPGLGGHLSGGGVRASVDPVTGDIYIAYGLNGAGSIVRVRDDGSSAEAFATGFGFVRDLDFGPASSGSGISLYITEHVNGQQGIVNTIYEANINAIPEPASAVLALLAFGGLAVRRRRAA